MSQSKILYIMTGSIAAYKACHVLSRLSQAGHEIQVVATPAALEFVGRATLEGLVGQKVLCDLYENGRMMDHIHLVRWADLIITAPATANYINKISQGIADDLASTLFLAHDFKKPWMIAPAMNTAMLQHPITQASILKLQNLGVDFIDSTAGVLACGEVGNGRLVEPEDLLKVVQDRLAKLKAAQGTQSAQAAQGSTFPQSIQKFQDLQTIQKSSQHTKTSGHRILITAGGTQEPIDSVRVISNSSSGSTGFQLAKNLSTFGFSIDLVMSQNAIERYSLVSELARFEDNQIQLSSFRTFQDLSNQIQSLMQKQAYTAVIHLAAVSDYSVAGVEIANKFISAEQMQDGKLSSQEPEMKLVLRRNPKIIDSLRSWNSKHQNKTLLIGFKLTDTKSDEARLMAVQKLFASSRADLVVHNDLSEINSGLHQFHVFEPGAETLHFQGASSLSDFLGSYIQSKGSVL